MVTISDIQSWQNAGKLPVFLTATCEFSQFDNPERYSAGEMVLNQFPGGAIALFTSTRTSIATTNSALDTSFFHNLIPPAGEPLPTLGDLIKISKNRTNNNGFLRNFVLLGDPALTITFPKYRVLTTEINHHAADVAPDTILGLSVVSVKGEVADFNGNKQDNFTGKLTVKIFDKPVNYKTLGNKPGNGGSYPQTFQFQNSLLGEEKVSVSKGEFGFSFVVPKDIALQFGKGKISYYASDNLTDANGYFDNFIIGGKDPGINPVNLGPYIRLFMDDTLFVSGDITSENPVLLAFLRDTNGINATYLGIGHEILAVLDNNTSHPIVLNDYYEPDPDSYQSGTVTYPMSDLSTGLHHLKLTAWDYYDNPSSAEIAFFVFDRPELSIGQVINFPNPVIDHTTFRFIPLQNAGAMDIQIQIFCYTGQVRKIIESSVPESVNTPVDILWDGRDDNGNKLVSGLYLYKVIVRGENGAFTQTTQKMIILN